MGEAVRTTVAALGELFDGPHATPTRRSKGPYFLNIASLQSGRLDLTQSDHVSNEDFERWTRRVTPQAGDLLFSYETRLGEAALMPEGVQACLGRRMALLRPDRSVVDPRYLLYFYLSPTFQRTIEQNAIHGATVTRIGLAAMPKWELELPELRQQRAIATVLSALDNKIAANENVLGLLDSLEEAEAARVVASARSTVQFGSIAEVISGVSYRRADLVESRAALVTLKSIDRRGAFSHDGFKPYAGEFKSAQRLEQGDMVVAKTDLTQKAEVIGRAVRIPRVDSFDILVASLDLAVVRPLARIPASYIVGALRQKSFREHCLARTSGTTVLHLGRGAIESYEFPLASEDAMQSYSDKASRRAELADSLTASSGALARTRDELLPLLMSGKLRVHDAEKVVEDVT